MQKNIILLLGIHGHLVYYRSPVIMVFTVDDCLVIWLFGLSLENVIIRLFCFRFHVQTAAAAAAPEWRGEAALQAARTGPL